jgi:hypothetical protein
VSLYAYNAISFIFQTIFMEQNTHTLSQRMQRLERLLLLSAVITGGLLLGFFYSFVSPVDGKDGEQIIRARGIVIVDETGKERIAIGAPVPDPTGYGKRISPSTGLIINDENGYERFGMGLDETGNMAMGFDAPHDKGDPRNPERINIVADANGGSFIRFLNNKTEVVSFLRLDENEEFCLEFLDRKTGKVMRRQMRYDGEKVIEWK